MIVPGSGFIAFSLSAGNPTLSLTLAWSTAYSTGTTGEFAELQLLDDTFSAIRTVSYHSVASTIHSDNMGGLGEAPNRYAYIGYPHDEGILDESGITGMRMYRINESGTDLVSVCDYYLPSYSPPPYATDFGAVNAFEYSSVSLVGKQLRVYCWYEGMEEPLPQETAAVGYILDLSTMTYGPAILGTIAEIFNSVYFNNVDMQDLFVVG